MINKPMKYFLALAFFFLIGFNIVNGQQQSGAQTIRLAQSIYEQGRLHELPELLNKNLANFTKSEKVSAYRLLTLANIYLEEPEEADKSMLNLLKTDPYFKPNAGVDPAEFVGLYKTFRTRPIYRLGIKLSLNASQPNVSSYNAVTDGNSKYSYKIGIGGGISGELPITDRISLNGEIYFLSKSFTNTSNALLNGVTYSTSTGIEKQSCILLPIMAQYLFLKKETKFIPFVTGGIAVDYLLSSKVSATHKRVANQSIDVKTLTLDRKKFNVDAVIGAGVKVRMAGGYISAEMRYVYGLTKVNSPSTLFTNQTMLADYNLSDGIFKVNSLLFNVGYVQNFFNPKKLKRKK
jgi:outer membrane protein W